MLHHLEITMGVNLSYPFGFCLQRGQLQAAIRAKILIAPARYHVFRFLIDPRVVKVRHLASILEVTAHIGGVNERGVLRTCLLSVPPMFTGFDQVIKSGDV